MASASRISRNAALRAGVAVRDVTPALHCFLYGYPHVERRSTAVHDPLLASAMYWNDGENEAVLISVDVIFLTKRQVAEARDLISVQTKVPRQAIMIAATHTHSGPVTLRMLSNEADKVVPPPNPRFVRKLIAAIVEAAVEAVRQAIPAEASLAVVNVPGIGTNRHDPAGVSDPAVPVLVVSELVSGELLGVLCVCSMHPTVLREDSTVVSGDFPAFARKYVQRLTACDDLCVVYFTGAAGNQSPRHVIRESTLAEAARLGNILGAAIVSAMNVAEPFEESRIDVRAANVDLPIRELPFVQEAKAAASIAYERLTSLRSTAAAAAVIRSAECDWFGACEVVTLARAQAQGRLWEVAQTCLPAEVQVVRIGPMTLIGWPGEVFAEYGIEIRRSHPNAFVVTLANGDLQGYLVTREAIERRTYESGNAIFESPASPERLVNVTLELLEDLQAVSANVIKAAGGQHE